MNAFNLVYVKSLLCRIYWITTVGSMRAILLITSCITSKDLRRKANKEKVRHIVHEFSIRTHATVVACRRSSKVLNDLTGCSVSVVVGRRTRDREVASSVPGRCIAQ